MEKLTDTVASGETLDDFQGWDELSTDQDFFDTVDEDDRKKTHVTKVLDDIGKDDTDDVAEDQKKDVKKEKQEDLFEQSEIDPDTETAGGGDEEEEEDGDDKVKVSPTVSTVTFLKDNGYIDFELEEDEELTEEKAGELIEDKFDEAINQGIKDMFEDLPDVVKNINKYALNGGNVEQLLTQLAQASPNDISDDIDLDDEGNQELVIRRMMESEDNDKEEIQAQIDYLKDSGKLKTIAEKKFSKWKKGREALIKQQASLREEAVKQQKLDIRKAKKDTSTLLNEKDDIQGLPFSREDKKVLPSYMNDKSIKLQNGNVITQMQKDLFVEVLNNKEASLQLAALLRNRNEDGTFNFESIQDSTQTELTKKVKKNLRRDQTSIPKGSQHKRTIKKRSLADYFD